MQVEKVDFIALQTQDAARSKRFYVDTLGLPLDRDTPAGFEVFAGQVCLSVWNPASGKASISRRIQRISRSTSATLPRARAELEANGVVFEGETLDTGVCHMAFFRDPDGNALMLHRRYAPYA